MARLHGLLEQYQEALSIYEEMGYQAQSHTVSKTLIHLPFICRTHNYKHQALKSEIGRIILWTAKFVARFAVVKCRGKVTGSPVARVPAAEVQRGRVFLPGWTLPPRCRLVSGGQE